MPKVAMVKNTSKLSKNIMWGEGDNVQRSIQSIFAPELDSAPTLSETCQLVANLFICSAFRFALHP